MHWVESQLREEIGDLVNRGLPCGDLETLCAALDEELGENDGPWPYFIPNDVTRCTPLSILNCSHIDAELAVDNGFVIEATSTRERSFAKPYYIDRADARRCKDLQAAQTYQDIHRWQYDFAFVGHLGLPCRPADIWDPRATRHRFLTAFNASFMVTRPEARIWLRLNPTNFFSEALAQEERDQRDISNRYIDALTTSRFVLCPRGRGTNSIRFFEALAVSAIPIYIGDAATRLPLDWIIDWTTVCFRISCEEVLDGSYASRLDELLFLSDAAVNRMRRRAFEIYHQFLTQERKRVFELLVLLRARSLLQGTA